MVPKKTDYQYRKDLILGIVVNEYIKTVSPISSGFIAKDYLSDLSSATIRNILAELEQEGFLTHPHTSAGRIPTEMGYRYYVNNLMDEIHLLEEEKQRIKIAYEKEKHDLETILNKTSEVISDLTHYTSIVSSDNVPDRIFYRGTRYIVEYPLSQDINQIRNILFALEEKEHLLEIINRQIQEKVKIYIGCEMTCLKVDGCSLAVSQYKVPSGASGKIAILGPTRMNYQKVISALEYISELMNDLL